jgi:hypothetical protein
MSEVKHTPGPWTISRYDDRPEMIVVKNGKEVETMVAYAYEGDVGIEEQRANARLIVHAPEMLALLEESLSAFVAHDEVGIPEKPLIRRIGKLIDEVTGGAE